MAARQPGLIAAALVAGVAVLYLGVIRSESGPNDIGIVSFYAGLMLLAAALSVGGSVANDAYWRRLLLGIAGAITLGCAWLGALSIGPLLLPAVLLLMFAFGRG